MYNNGAGIGPATSHPQPTNPTCHTHPTPCAVATNHPPTPTHLPDLSNRLQPTHSPCVVVQQRSTAVANKVCNPPAHTCRVLLKKSMFFCLPISQCQRSTILSIYTRTIESYYGRKTYKSKKQNKTPAGKGNLLGDGQRSHFRHHPLDMDLPSHQLTHPTTHSTRPEKHF